MKDHQHLTNEFHRPGKTKRPEYKILLVWIKNEENFEKISRKLVDFSSKSLWKIDFFTFFTKYFLDFWLLSKSIYLWKITPDFYNNFSDFVGRGERSSVPPSRRYSKDNSCSYQNCQKLHQSIFKIKQIMNNKRKAPG